MSMMYRWWRGVISGVILVAFVLQAPVAAIDETLLDAKETATEAVAPVTPGSEVDVLSEPIQISEEVKSSDTLVSQPELSVSQTLEQPVAPALLFVESNDVLPEPIEQLAPMISEVQVSGACPDTVCSGNNVEFVELYNPNAQPLALTGMKLRYHGGGAAPTEYDLVDLNDVVLAAGELAVVGRNMSGAVKKTFTRQLADSAGAVRIVTATGGLVDQVAWGGATKSFYMHAAEAPETNKSLQRCFVDGQLVNAIDRDTSQEFIVYVNELASPGIALTCPVPSEPVDPAQPNLPVNDCEGLRLSEIGANITQQFIEVHNTVDELRDVTGCRLMTNRSASVFFDLSSSIAPRGYLVVGIEKTPLSLTKTTTGTVYLLSSEGAEVDSQSYANLAKDTSWSLVDGVWRQTYAITPGLANTYQQYVACDMGYERNEETGRCRKIEQAAGLVDCEEGKYRSQETGRCRNVSVEPALTACASNQYRSPETNRCRKAVSGGDASAGFEVVKDDSVADQMASWLALGGVGSLALGYAAWEWRREVVGALGKAFGSLPFVK